MHVRLGTGDRGTDHAVRLVLAGHPSAEELAARLQDRLPALKRLAGVAAPSGADAPPDGSQQQPEASIEGATSQVPAQPS